MRGLGKAATQKIVLISLNWLQFVFVIIVLGNITFSFMFLVYVKG